RSYRNVNKISESGTSFALANQETFLNVDLSNSALYPQRTGNCGSQRRLHMKLIHYFTVAVLCLASPALLYAQGRPVPLPKRPPPHTPKRIPEGGIPAMMHPAPVGNALQASRGTTVPSGASSALMGNPALQSMALAAQ